MTKQEWKELANAGAAGYDEINRRLKLEAEQYNKDAIRNASVAIAISGMAMLLAAIAVLINFTK